MDKWPSEPFNMTKAQPESWCLYSWNGPSAAHLLSMGGDWSLRFRPSLLLMPYLTVAALAQLSLMTKGWGGIWLQWKPSKGHFDKDWVGKQMNVVCLTPSNLHSVLIIRVKLQTRPSLWQSQFTRTPNPCSNKCSAARSVNNECRNILDRCCL